MGFGVKSDDWETYADELEAQMVQVAEGNLGLDAAVVQDAVKEEN